MKKLLIVIFVLVALSVSVAAPRLAGYWNRQTPVTPVIKPSTTAADKPKPAKPTPAKPSPAPTQPVSPPAEQDHSIFSWWFKSNTKHEPPQFDAKVLTMVKGTRSVYLGDTSHKVVYLTFDEGYENGYTPAILDTLKANGIHAAFFVTADFVDKQPGLVKRMAAEGHVIGNHTVTHPSLPTLSNSDIDRELRVTGDKVRELTGIDMGFMRPPKGEYNRRVLEEAGRVGYTSVFWSMAYRDWDVNNQPGREKAVAHVLGNLHPGAVILLHAVSQSNTDALDEIIKGIRAEGYSFGSLEELK